MENQNPNQFTFSFVRNYKPINNGNVWRHFPFSGFKPGQMPFMNALPMLDMGCYTAANNTKYTIIGNLSNGSVIYLAPLYYLGASYQKTIQDTIKWFHDVRDSYCDGVRNKFANLVSATKAFELLTSVILLYKFTSQTYTLQPQTHAEQLQQTPPSNAMIMRNLEVSTTFHMLRELYSASSECLYNFGMNYGIITAQISEDEYTIIVETLLRPMFSPNFLDEVTAIFKRQDEEYGLMYVDSSTTTSTTYYLDWGHNISPYKALCEELLKVYPSSYMFKEMSGQMNMESFMSYITRPYVSPEVNMETTNETNQILREGIMLRALRNHVRYINKVHQNNKVVETPDVLKWLDFVRDVRSKYRTLKEELVNKIKTEHTDVANPEWFVDFEFYRTVVAWAKQLGLIKSPILFDEKEIQNMPEDIKNIPLPVLNCEFKNFFSDVGSFGRYYGETMTTLYSNQETNKIARAIAYKLMYIISDCATKHEFVLNCENNLKLIDVHDKEQLHQLLKDLLPIPELHALIDEVLPFYSNLEAKMKQEDKEFDGFEPVVEEQPVNEQPTNESATKPCGTIVVEESNFSRVDESKCEIGDIIRYRDGSKIPDEVLDSILRGWAIATYSVSRSFRHIMETHMKYMGVNPNEFHFKNAEQALMRKWFVGTLIAPNLLNGSWGGLWDSARFIMQQVVFSDKDSFLPPPYNRESVAALRNREDGDKLLKLLDLAETEFNNLVYADHGAGMDLLTDVLNLTDMVELHHSDKLPVDIGMRCYTPNIAFDFNRDVKEIRTAINRCEYMFLHMVMGWLISAPRSSARVAMIKAMREQTREDV